METPTEEEKQKAIEATENLKQSILKTVEEALDGLVEVCKDHCDREEVPFIGMKRLVEFKEHFMGRYREHINSKPVETIPDPKPMDAHDDLGGAKKLE